MCIFICIYLTQREGCNHLYVRTHICMYVCIYKYTILCISSNILRVPGRGRVLPSDPAARTRYSTGWLAHTRANPLVFLSSSILPLYTPLYPIVSSRSSLLCHSTNYHQYPGLHRSHKFLFPTGFLFFLFFFFLFFCFSSSSLFLPALNWPTILQLRLWLLE